MFCQKKGRRRKKKENAESSDKFRKCQDYKVNFSNVLGLLRYVKNVQGKHMIYSISSIIWNQTPFILRAFRENIFLYSYHIDYKEYKILYILLCRLHNRKLSKGCTGYLQNHHGHHCSVPGFWPRCSLPLACAWGRPPIPSTLFRRVLWLMLILWKTKSLVDTVLDR